MYSNNKCIDSTHIFINIIKVFFSVYFDYQNDQLIVCAPLNCLLKSFSLDDVNSNNKKNFNLHPKRISCPIVSENVRQNYNKTSLNTFV